MQIELPYGRTTLQAPLSDERVLATLENTETIPPQNTLVDQALANPYGQPLHLLAQHSRRILIICSDHTRPVPSRVIIPAMLREIRRTNKNAEIILLVATGCHRASTTEELIEKFGESVVQTTDIRMHDSTQSTEMVDIGALPSGARLRVNKLILWADLVVSEGFVEPHFFAGFSGGRKSVLPGVAAAETVMQNHCAGFIAHGRARTGVLAGNPVHADMVHAAKLAKLRFIVNVAINRQKEIVGAWAGDAILAHEAACSSVLAHASVKAPQADIVITSNGGYPLDQNIYQAVKCMTAAEACVKPNGVIIVVAQCIDGSGSENFYQQCSQPMTPAEILEAICVRSPEETQPDQWQTQIMMRVLMHARVIMVSEPALQTMIEQMHMTYASTLSEAIHMAEEWMPNGKYVIIPDGVSVIVQ